VGGDERDNENPLCFVAGNLAFAVDVGPDLKHAVLQAFSGIQLVQDQEAGVSFQVTRIDGASDPSWRLSGPNTPSYIFADPQRLLSALVTAVNLTALDSDPAALHLHAAAASRDGDAIVVVGESGSGKTTLVANLSASGWSYITDEMVRLTADASMITGFAKPLSIRSISRDLIAAAAADTDTDAARGVSQSATMQVSPVELGFSLAGEAQPRLILCTRVAIDDRRGAEPNATWIAPADAVVRMMAQTMDAERFGVAALGVLARIAAGCDCYDLDVGEPEAMVALVSKLADRASRSELAVELVTGSRNTAENVATAFIGDGAAIWNSGTGMVIALDAPGCLIWRALVDMNGSAKVDLTAPVESQFVSQLQSLGLLVEPLTAAQI
jgi:hypothetical protein